MAYDGTKTWGQFEQEVQNMGRTLIEQLTRAEEFYKDMVVYQNGRSNAEIATVLGRTEAEIEDLSSAIVAFHKLFQLGEGLTTQASAKAHLNDLRKFT